MTNTASGIIHKAKTFSLVSVYALASFALAGLLVGITPESFHFAILVGWIVSIFIGGKLIQTR